MGRGLYASVVKILLKNSCNFVKQGKGSHEIWYSPLSGKHFPVAVTIVSRHTANEILKQAGIAEKI